jgi:hypothetical protein
LCFQVPSGGGGGVAASGGGGGGGDAGAPEEKEEKKEEEKVCYSTAIGESVAYTQSVNRRSLTMTWALDCSIRGVESSYDVDYDKNGVPSATDLLPRLCALKLCREEAINKHAGARAGSAEDRNWKGLLIELLRR